VAGPIATSLKALIVAKGQTIGRWVGSCPIARQEAASHFCLRLVATFFPHPSSFEFSFFEKLTFSLLGSLHRRFFKSLLFSFLKNLHFHFLKTLWFKIDDR
jgi:hypothetical protein